MDLKVQFPDKLRPLFQPARYKVCYGGRGGAKSWGIARALLVLGIRNQLRILCARELQKSIKDSVHKLLSDQIKAMNLESVYEIQQATIKGKNGTEFFFEALRHNAAQIKSYEGVDIVWVEEATTVSKTSWDILIPTVRKEGSEIWISFNPELEEDETYQRFVLTPHTNSIVMKLNWQDNPWFPDVLRQEKDDLKQRDPDGYLTTWEGHCRVTLEGAIYADEIRKAKEENRICSVPHNTTLPVHIFFDLGYADNTSIWFIQKVGFEYHVIDFYQDSQKSIQHYVNYVQKKPYVYGTDYLPHDGRAKQLGTGKSIQETMQSLGRSVQIVPSLSIVDGINAVRTVFPACYFDAAKCADGLQALRRYRYDTDPNSGRISRNPLHDINSHAADALRTFGVEPNVQWDSVVNRTIWDAGRESNNHVISDYDPLRECVA